MSRRHGFPIMGGFGGMGMGMGSPLLTALLSGGLGYAVGSGAGQQRMSEEQNARIGQLEQQQQQQQQQSATPYQAYPQGAPTPQSGGASAATSESDRLAQLRLLGQLHNEGVLTDDEFEREKMRVLRG